MNSKDIVNLRLKNHYLSGQLTKPEEAVGWLGAVQAQDFNAAKWSIGLRLQNSSDKAIEDAYNQGKFLRTHVMRPTWHFVLPEDLYWMQQLTASNVKRKMNHYNRKLELTDGLFKKSQKIIIKSLKNKNYLTRKDIKKLLEETGIKTDVQRLAHIVSRAELDVLICSGPMKGKQFTYSLFEERAEKFVKLTKEDSLAKLALKYFQSHGPAQVRDFSWWSGLSVNESEKAISLVKQKLFSENVEGKKYFFFPATHYSHPSSLTYLVSVYDEYFIGYKDRSLILEEKNRNNMANVGNALLTSLIIVNGHIKGTWKKITKKNSLEIRIKPFHKLNDKEKSEIENEVRKYGKFQNKKTILEYFRN